MSEIQSTQEKYGALQHILKEMGNMVLAYSGGADSCFFSKPRKRRGDNVLAVTAVSPVYTGEEYERARDLALSLGARHISIRTNELENPDFQKNSPQRCYYCKKELFRKLRNIAEQKGVLWVADASNLDDCAAYRPGTIAAKEAGIRSPLLEAGLKKEEIRALAKEMNLRTWDLPAAACLASRFPYGEGLTLEKIRRVEQAEKFLRDLGFRRVRVRSHDRLARIEVDTGALDEFFNEGLRSKVFRKLKSLGFIYVTLDLEGYRTGSLNEVFPTKDQNPSPPPFTNGGKTLFWVKRL
jgi:uncharacterized protein